MFAEQSFDKQGNYRRPRASWEIIAAIAAYLTPVEAPTATRS